MTETEKSMQKTEMSIPAPGNSCKNELALIMIIIHGC